MKARTKALAIPKEVKIAVAKRDSVDGWPNCIWCGDPAPTDNETAYSCCHYIPRSQGGLGIEQNILTLCPRCHLKFDQSTDRETMRPVFRKYLRSQYEDWDETKLIYRRN